MSVSMNTAMHNTETMKTIILITNQGCELPRINPQFNIPESIKDKEMEDTLRLELCSHFPEQSKLKTKAQVGQHQNPSRGTQNHNRASTVHENCKLGTLSTIDLKPEKSNQNPKSKNHKSQIAQMNYHKS